MSAYGTQYTLTNYTKRVEARYNIILIREHDYMGCARAIPELLYKKSVDAYFNRTAEECSATLYVPFVEQLSETVNIAISGGAAARQQDGRSKWRSYFWPTAATPLRYDSEDPRQISGWTDIQGI